jgi:predicted HAD superfamily phosphohydrolase
LLYRHTTKNGTPESHARNDGNTGFLASHMDTDQAKIDTNQAENDTTLKEIRAGQELQKEEMLAKLDAYHKRMMTKMDSWLEKIEACLGKMKATDLEAYPAEIESEAEHEEVPNEEAAVKTVRARRSGMGAGI